MTSDFQHVETEAWYFERWIFARGRRGSLALRDGRLSFVTALAGTSSTLYEKVGATGETIFDVALTGVESISFNWLTGGMTLMLPTQRHLVSFASPPSGRHFDDVRALVAAITTLSRWRAALVEAEPGLRHAT